MANQHKLTWIRDLVEARDSIKSTDVPYLRDRFGWAYNRALVARALLLHGADSTSAKVSDSHRAEWRRLTAGDPDIEVDAPKVEQDGDGLHVSYGGLAPTEHRSDLVTNPEEMCEVAGVDLDRWRIVRSKVNRWTTTLKGNDGEPRVVVNWQVKVDLEPVASILLKVPEVMGIEVPPAVPVKSSPDGVAVFLGDPQVGHRWSEGHHKLMPTHDPLAMDLALQVCEKLQPDYIIFPGDNLDLAELSTKFPRAPGLWDTTQSALIECAWWLGQFRAACPNAQIYWLNGNHEGRLARLLRERAPVLETLADVHDGNMALDLGKLMHFEQLGVIDVGPYPDGELWLFDGMMRYHHGTKVGAKGGQTATKVLADATSSEAFGHVHRLEMASRTVHGAHGPRVLTALSPGCLCSVTGATPGVTSRPDWQQGVAITTSEDGRLDHELIRFDSGVGRLRGELLKARDRGDALARATRLRG